MRVCILFFLVCLSFLFEIQGQATYAECGTMHKQSWANTLRNKKSLLHNPGATRSQMNAIPYQIHLMVKVDSSTAITLQEIYNEMDSVNYFYANAAMSFFECLPPEIIYDDSGLVDASCNYTGTALDLNNMPYTPDVTNIMSYSRKICRVFFSPTQYVVMNNVFFTERNYLSCLTTGQPISAQPALLSVFPNPGKNELNLYMKSNGSTYHLVLLNCLGQKIAEERFNGEMCKINTQGFSPGIYFISLSSPGRSFSGKWVKE